MPNETALVIRLLDELIEASPEEAYKSAILPKGFTECFSENYDIEKEVFREE